MLSFHISANRSLKKSLTRHLHNIMLHWPKYFVHKMIASYQLYFPLMFITKMWQYVFFSYNRNKANETY